MRVREIRVGGKDKIRLRVSAINTLVPRIDLWDHTTQSTYTQGIDRFPACFSCVFPRSQSQGESTASFPSFSTYSNNFLGIQSNKKNHGWNDSWWSFGHDHWTWWWSWFERLWKQKWIGRGFEIFGLNAWTMRRRLYLYSARLHFVFVFFFVTNSEIPDKGDVFGRWYTGASLCCQGRSGG